MPSQLRSFTEKPREWICVILEIFGMLASLFVLGLSFKKSKESFNVGPRIFAVNLMLANIVLSVVSYLRDYGLVNEEFLDFYYSLGEFVSWKFALQSLMLLIFNCSFVPMMVVTLISLYSSHVLSTCKNMTLFAAIILVAALNVLVIIPPGHPKTMLTTAYVATSFVFYALQLVITAVALAVIHKKSQHQHFTGRTLEEAKAKLVRTMMFSIGPCIVQVPFACLMLAQLLRNDSSVWISITSNLGDVVSIVFALKPTVDAFSMLLFMGEYRHYTMSFVRPAKKLSVKLWNAKSFKTAVEHLPSANTVTVAPVAATQIHTHT